jgi:hypothetical protein
MSWLRELEGELIARRVRRPVRQRLIAELADHIASEPGFDAARLGPARDVAGRYADELAGDDARRAALWAFGALALTAVALLVTQATLGGIGYPGFDRGFSAALSGPATSATCDATLSGPAIIALVFASQVALVAGTLAAWRALRRRREPVLPGAEVALLGRRTRIALAAGFVVCAAIGLYAVDFAIVLPVWWLALAGGLAVLAAAALAAAWRVAATGAATVTLAGGPAGDIYDDLPPLRRLRGHPLRLWAAVALFSGLAMTLFEWHAEHSFGEGLQRGVAEAAAFTLCFALLGRAIGARGAPGRSSPGAPHGSDTP